MKNINIKIIGVFVVAVLIFSGCKKWIDTEININPDATTDVPMSTILPTIQVNMGYVTVGGNDISRITAIWLQYFQGTARQSQSQADYNLREGDINNQWQSNYAESMMNLKILMDKATGSNAHYLGIAQVLMANSLGLNTDFWGDIPYTEAFQGDANLTPIFNTQQEIYGFIQQLLDDAIANFALSAGPVEGDMMYGGDVSLWTKAAYAFKARYHLHLSKKDPQAAYGGVLANLPFALAGNGEDLEFIFGTVSSEANPLWQFMSERGDVSMNTYFIDMLLLRFDPRLVVYADTNDTGGYSGNGPGETSNAVSAPGVAVASMNSPIPFISYVECLFMQAEAEYATLAPDATVRATLIAAVTASMEKQGVYSSIYMAAYDSTMQGYSGQLLFGEVMMQKYIALYCQAEPFTDWRRTGIPQLVSNVPGTEVPRRYPYPTSEITYNPNTPSYGTIWSRVWWDTP